MLPNGWLRWLKGPWVLQLEVGGFGSYPASEKGDSQVSKEFLKPTGERRVVSGYGPSSRSEYSKSSRVLEGR